MRVATLEAIAKALNEARVPFLIVGGLAVNAHGVGRFTMDLDLVIRLSPPTIHDAFSALRTLGYRPRVPISEDDFADPDRRAGWIREKHMTVLGFHSDRHRDTPVDLFVTEPFDFDQEYAAALVQDVAPGVPVRIVRLATLARLKREAGRPKDLSDLSELKLLHGDLGDD